MKKNYMKPSMDVVMTAMADIVCGSVTSVSSNSGLNYGGGGNGPARSKEHGGIWDDED